MRAFIAIDISAETRQSIQLLIDEARQGTRGIKWVGSGNMHLTLKFLGEVGESRISEISNRLRQACAAHKAFNIGLRGTGAFPDLRRPNVLWVGVDESPELAGLFESVDAAMAGAGFAREKRRFSPHLTIARVREGADPGAALKVLSTYATAFFGTIDVREILLMESVLKPSGPEYRRTAAAPLAVQ